MRFLTIILLLSGLLYSCKNREARIYEFVENFNSVSDNISDTTIISKKAFYLGKKGLNIDYILKITADSLAEEELFNKVNSDLQVVFDKFPNGRDLIDEEILVNLRLYDRYGSKIVEKEVE